MRVFKSFFSIVKYYSVMIVIYLVIFIVMTVILSNVESGTRPETFTSEKSDIAIINNDSSELSSSIVKLLSEKHNVKKIENDQQILTDALYNRKVSYIITIPKDFEHDFKNSDSIPTLQTQAVPNSYSNVYISSLLDSYLNTIKAYLKIGLDINTAIDNANTDMDKNVDVEFSDKNESGRAPIFFFYNYLPYAILMISMLGIGMALMAFFKKEVAMRTNASAISLTRKNMELGLSMSVMAIGLLIILIAFASILYGADILSSGSFVCMLNMVCFSVFSVSLAFLIGILSKNATVISGASNALGLAMCFIGGIFVPREVMNEGVLNIAKFVPTYWYTNVIEKIAYGGGLNAKMDGSMAIDMMIQLLFAAALIAIAMVVSKQKRRVG